MKGTKTRILIIDDEPTTLSLIESVLHDGGYSVFAVSSVKEAIMILEKYVAINLILSDIEMPEQDGFALMRFLGKNMRFADIPVVICTGHADAPTVVQALRYAVRGYVVKPIAKNQLLSKIQAILDSGKGTVMIASNDALNVEIIAASVAREGYKPVIACNREESEAILAKAKVDVLITDEVLPGISGMDLMVRVKELDQNVPVFFIEDHVTRLVEEKIIAAGADGVIRKPFSNREICNKISSYRRVKRNTALREIEVIRKVLKSQSVSTNNVSS